MEKETDIIQEWLEFKTPDKENYINIRKDLISEVLEDCYFNDRTTICMKNGNKYSVQEEYEKVIEML